ncbi:MAG: aminopeptidase [Bacillota bacterium]|nr:aminopeptidase [Bacillota bacterium]
MEKIQKGIERALFYCLGLQPQERLLIVTDDIMANLANLFYEVARDHSINVAVLKIPSIGMDGTEPPSIVADALRDIDVAVLITRFSMTHTRARERATNRGTRIACLPGFTRQMLAGPLMVDYEELKHLSVKMSRFLDSAETAYLLSEQGTCITMSLEERVGFADFGIYTMEGDCGNLPAGEAFIAPVEGSANGKVVIDGTMTGIGMLKSPMTLIFERGHVTKIEGGSEGLLLKAMMDEAGRGATNFAELGIGTNRGSILTGDILSDEKSLGTVHIALGDNMNFGGTVDSRLHIDGVIKEPTLYLDDFLIIDKGVWMV